MSRRNKPKGKKINPTYWVFCEGKTEAEYTSYLRSKYRLPIEIITKKSGSSISEEYIERSKRGKPTHAKDKDYLMYDGDVIEIVEKIRSIENATALISTPSIELWFLLHYKNQNSCTTEKDCIRELTNRNKRPYNKGSIDSKLKEKLEKNQDQATSRAKSKDFPNNPSSNMYLLLEDLDRERKK